MSSMNILITMFIGIIVGVALVGAVADNIFLASNPVVLANENNSIETLRTASEAEVHANVTRLLGNDDIITIDSVALSNGTLITQDTDFFLNDTIGIGTGIPRVSFANTSIMYIGRQNFTTWNYTHAGDRFIQGSNVSITLLNLVTIFFVIGILALALVGLRRTEIFQGIMGK